MIEAYARSDDQRVKVDFDATKWFEQATDAEIVALARSEWGGDYEADAVAQFFNEVGGKNSTHRLFKYLDIIHDSDDCGFECHIDEEAARAWLRVHRPKLVVE